jgi:type IV secretion system protein VirB10
MTVSWYRIITPSGVNIKLEGELSDAKGASGITGEIDRRMVDRYGMAFALSIFNAAAQLSVPVDDLRYRAAADSSTREFSAVTGQLIRESLKVMPTIKIPQGTRINISPIQDIWFKEPKNNEVLVSPVND